jgi:hypothetical protein
VKTRLGLRDIFRAAIEAHDAIGGPTLGAAVLVIVRERTRLRNIIDDLRAGVERLKTECRDLERARHSLVQEHETVRKRWVSERLAATRQHEIAVWEYSAEVERLTLALGQACAAGETLQRERDDAERTCEKFAGQITQLEKALAPEENG